MQETTFTTIQKQTVRPQFLNAAGSPVAVDGPPAWRVDDETIATIDVAPDGLSASVIAGAPGVTFITVTADALIGPDTREVSGQFQVTITESGAVRVEFVFDDATDK